MTATTQRAPYGSWRSPISAAALTAETIGLAEPRLDADSVFWLEGRPREAGRVVLVRRGPDGGRHDITGPPFNVRSRVHEYGGGGYDVFAGVVVFCHFDDRRVYRVDLGPDGRPTGDPRPITPVGDLRYGNLRLVSVGGRPTSLLAVCEDHGTGGEPANRLVRLWLDGDNADGGLVLAQGSDFVASAAESPDGLLAWVRWDHPNMPWDSTQVCVAALAEDGSVAGPPRVVAGTPGESVLQPQWAPDGRLVFLSDRTGYWNLYALDVADESAEPVRLSAADHDFAGPHWNIGASSYGIADDGRILCSWLDEGWGKIGTLDPATGELAEIPAGLAGVGSVFVRGRGALLLAGFADRPTVVAQLDLDSPKRFEDQRLQDRRLEELCSGSTSQLDATWVSTAEAVSWPDAEGRPVHGFFYPPRNPDFAGTEDERPPLLVLSHGGPTGMFAPVFAEEIQFWTTRGFAVLQVNYGGSAGYGRAYRERLKGRWGIVDVDDCASGALAMAAQGRADRTRLAIRGGSAGGFTTLAALTFRDVFAVGSSWFGVGDLGALARDTHKFESRYLDGLIGPYPEARDVYLERSPVYHVDQLNCPIILLQGADDRVVPPNQAEEMAAAVRAKGLPVALIVFPGEGHGFRRAENLIRALDAEQDFFAKVFGYEPADDVEPAPIDAVPVDAVPVDAVPVEAVPIDKRA